MKQARLAAKRRVRSRTQHASYKWSSRRFNMIWRMSKNGLRSRFGLYRRPTAGIGMSIVYIVC